MLIRWYHDKEELEDFEQDGDVNQEAPSDENELGSISGDDGLLRNEESNMQSTATSKFEDFRHSKQTGFDDVDFDNNADDDILDNGKSNIKVCALFILTIQIVYCHQLNL